MTKLIVGVDGSEGSADALRWAVEEGQVRGWPIVAVLAWGYFDQHYVEPDHPFDPNYSEQDAQRALSHYLVAVVGEEEAAKIEARVVCDIPARALLESCGEDVILVLGARGLGGFRGLLLGSVSQHCLHHAHCPVVVVRRGTSYGTSRPARIVVGIDGSEQARSALRWAVDQAAATGAQLDVVHAWHTPYANAAPLVVMAIPNDELRQGAQEVLDLAIRSIHATDLAHPPQGILIEDSAAGAILDTAKDADLVVVGSRGRGGFAGLVLGSVSAQVARHATCPVVVVPPTAR